MTQFYPKDTAPEEMDSFSITRFVFIVNKKGHGSNTWDVQILGSPDDARELYLVRGDFYLEIVQNLQGKAPAQRNKTTFLANALQFEATMQEIFRFVNCQSSERILTELKSTLPFD